MYFENKKFWMVVDQNVNRGCLKTGDLGRGVGYIFSLCLFSFPLFPSMFKCTYISI